MALEPFASAQQMADRSGGVIPADHPYLATALEAASTRIRNYCGWQIYPLAVVEDLRIRTTYGHYLWLPTTHLVSIEGISNAGVWIDADALALVDWSEDGRVDYVAWASPSLISFTHGYEEAPADLVDLTLELAFGEMASRGVLREQTLASSITWARASGKLTDDDHTSLATYKIGWMP